MANFSPKSNPFVGKVTLGKYEGEQNIAVSGYLLRLKPLVQ